MIRTLVLHHCDFLIFAFAHRKAMMTRNWAPCCILLLSIIAHPNVMIRGAQFFIVTVLFFALLQTLGLQAPCCHGLLFFIVIHWRATMPRCLACCHCDLLFSIVTHLKATMRRSLVFHHHGLLLLSVAKRTTRGFVVVVFFFYSSIAKKMIIGASIMVFLCSFVVVWFF